MPLPNLPIPKYPSVPALDGVPSLLRSAGEAIAPISHYYALSQYLGAQTERVWGVFNGDSNDKKNFGERVITPDSFFTIDVRESSKVADYIMQAGAFASYNKVTDPTDVIVGMAFAGTYETRTRLLAVLRMMKESFTPLTVLTPEVTFNSVILESFNYQRRAENGATMLIVSCRFKQIRATVQANYTQTTTPMSATAVQAPSAAAQLSNGAVQAVPTTTELSPYIARPVQ